MKKHHRKDRPLYFWDDDRVIGALAEERRRTLARAEIRERVKDLHDRIARQDDVELRVALEQRIIALVEADA